MALHTTSQAAGHPVTNASAEEAAITAAKLAYAKLEGEAGKRKKKSFQTILHSATTVDTIIDCIQQAHDKHKKQASSRLLAQFQKHSEWLSKLFEAIDDVVKASTAIQCSISAPLRLCLQVSDCHSVITEQIVVMIDTMHHTMGRINIYKQSSPNPALYTAMVSVFTDVVDFCYLALKFFNHSAFVRLFKLLVSPAKKKFQGVIDDLRRHTEHVDFTANALEHIEMKQFREELRVESRLEYWLRALDAPNMRQRKEDMVKDQVEGTCDWILSHENFKTWKTTTHIRERLLSVSGKGGCGKSFLSASVIEHLAAENQNNRVMYLFFSEKGNKHRAPEDTLARSALSQMLQELQGAKDGDELSSLLDQMSKFSDPTTMDLWATVLKAIQNSKQAVFWVIDGLDECLDGLSPLDDERKLDDAIRRLMEYLTELLSSHTPSRVMILGRPHAVNGVKEDKYPHISIAIDDDMITEDLSKYILAKTKESSFLRQDTQSSLLETINKTLLEKSQGTFLWLRLVMNDIQSWASSDEADSALGTLPDGLKARYNQMIQRLEKSKAYDIEVISQVFGFLATAGRPLNVEELRYSQGMARWIEKKAKSRATLEECLIHEPGKKLLDVCGGFVHIQNGKIIFVHLTAKEYLLEYAAETRFKVDLLASHRVFGEVCMEYIILQGDDVIQHEENGISPTTTANSPPLLSYATRHLVHHLARSGALGPKNQERILLFMQTHGFSNWLKTFLKSCFDFRFLHDMEQDLIALLGWLNPEKLTTLSQGGWETALSMVRAKRRSENQSSIVCAGQSQNFEHLRLLVNVLSGEDSISDEDGRIVAGSNRATWPFIRMDFRHITTFLEMNNTIPVAPIISAFRSLRDLPVLRSVSQALAIIFDPLKKLCELIVGSCATIPTIVLIGIAFLYLDTGRHDEALPIFLTAKKQLLEDSHLFKYWVGVALMRLNKPEEAEPLLRDAVSSLHPIMTIDCHRRYQTLWLGRCFFYQKKFDKAEDMFRQGISQGQTQPDSATLHNSWGLAATLFCKELYQDAAELYTQIAAELMKGSNETRVDYNYGLSPGIAWFFSQNYALSEEALKNHLDLIQKTLDGATSEEMNTRVWLGKALKSQEKYLEAEFILRPVVQQLKDLGLLEYSEESLYESTSAKSDNDNHFTGGSEVGSTYTGEDISYGEDHTGNDGENDAIHQDEDNPSHYGKQSAPEGDGAADCYVYSGYYRYNYKCYVYDISRDYRTIGNELRREALTRHLNQVSDLLEIAPEVD